MSPMNSIGAMENDRQRRFLAAFPNRQQLDQQKMHKKFPSMFMDKAAAARDGGAKRPPAPSSGSARNHRISTHVLGAGLFHFSPARLISISIKRKKIQKSQNPMMCVGELRVRVPSSGGGRNDLAGAPPGRRTRGASVFHPFHSD